MSIFTTRRAVLAGLAASAAMPLAAQASFTAAFDRARALDQLRALVIAQDGEVVAAEAVRGPSLETPVNVKSVSKSVVSALTGIAIARGELLGVEATLDDVAPNLVPQGAEDGVGDITIENLLTMRAGLERTSGGNYGAWVQSGNWVTDALSRPFVAEPGGQMLYSTGSTHVLGAVLAEVSGQSLLELARRRIGDPLDIEIPPWTRDPQGRYMGGNNMALSPLGMIRFGEAWRTDLGVVPRDWVEAAWSPHTRSRFSGDGYGYGWFLSEFTGRDAVYARGYGGQMIWVIPSLRLTVAVTSDPDRPARSRGYAGDLHRLVAETVVREVRRAG
ncbi:serine hydrolase domain-containing protein [Roseitranquillus sediminis]|uniref:serine hydrolase domain-containing protein n=1 Tax=Roseitranquillus sediminis TaxID=2809051 RepID=UPI001D0C11CE|nr:serine hydrolase [Roseitranquillus sediminis]MBM9593080.1 serine hydrolase [Roseitranquillus sediminis]